MTDFLLELRSEEIPARMQDRAREDLARLFAAEIAKAGLVARAIETYATPRRLALIARGLPAATEAVREETKGPRASAPPQALEGFLRKTGLAREDLIERDGVLFAIFERPGRATADVLADAVPAIVRGFPWPKSMRWGAASADTASLRWVRPLQGIVALYGDDVVPLAIDGIASGAATLGHRFHHPGLITIGNADDYAAKLKACHVIVDQAERAAIIEAGAADAAAAQSLRVISDAGLVAENAGLTEWPVPLLGTFDPAFLDVPREVIQLTMRTNQKYFACVDEAGALAPAFICTANIVAEDGGVAIVAGNRKVLAARLADARFFWEQDLKVPLAVQAKKLDRIVFHEKLGTVADKAARVAKLARWLVEEGIVKPPPLPQAGGAASAQPARGGDMAAAASSPPRPAAAPPASGRGEAVAALADQAGQAALLCKADLVTGMVGEFPELQGVMGSYYARHQGLPDAVADAIRDHYKPVGQGDEVPTAPVTVAVSLADKLDTIANFFWIGERPTGSKDPFALRRATLGCLELSVRYSLIKAILKALELRNKQLTSPLQEGAFDAVESGWREEGTLTGLDTLMLWNRVKGILPFFAERLKVQQREAGVRHDLIDAVFALGGEDDLVRLLARVKALQGFVATGDGANLLAGYKRAANILKKEGWSASAPPEAQGIEQDGEEDPLVLVDDPLFAPVVADLLHGQGAAHAPTPSLPAEAVLTAALDDAEPRAAAAVAVEDFEGAMAALASLRGPIDAFFEQVTVNDPDPATRARRLGLLGRVRAACHTVADFSKIEG